MSAHSPRPPHRCERCGVNTEAKYCRSCRVVDPEFCSDYLDRNQMARLRAARMAEVETDYQMYIRVIGRSPDRRRKSSQRNSA